MTFAARRFTKLIQLGRAFTSEGRHVSMSVGFNDSRVQKHLQTMTGLEFERIFRYRKQELSMPVYNLLTEEELQKLHEETTNRAKELLKMPPVLLEREKRGKEIEKDERLEGFDDYNWIFVDISMNKEDKDRYIVVRETNGTLREGTWEERDRLCQMYHPKPGRKLWLPTLLTEEQLPNVLKSGLYLHALDLVCVQCPPDSKDFIRVHHTVYEHIINNCLFQELYSTKHFGGMVWHLLHTQSCLSGLMESFLEHKQHEEAESLVNLYCLCWPESSFTSFTSSVQTTTPTGLELIKLFCNHFGYSTAEDMITTIINNSEQLLSDTNV